MTDETKPAPKPRKYPPTILEQAEAEAAAVREGLDIPRDDKAADEMWKLLEIPNTTREEEQAEWVRKRWLKYRR